jgi:hypothetical protein
MDTETNPPQHHRHTARPSRKYRLKPGEVYLERSGRRRLYVEATCKNGHTRLLPKHYAHAELCKRCSYDSRSTGPVAFICKGDNPYRTLIPLEKRTHAPGCPFLDDRMHETWKTRKQITATKWYNTALDEINGEYRSKPCSEVVNGTRSHETKVLAYLNDAAKVFSSSRALIKCFHKIAGFYPHDVPKKVESKTRLRSLHKICNKLSDEAQRRGLNLRVFDPNRFQPGHKTVVGRLRENSLSQQKGQLLQYHQKQNAFELPETVRGWCVFCDKLLLSPTPVKYHAAPCYQDSKRRFEPEEQIRMPGRQKELETFRKYWSWANLWDLGVDPSEIARSFDVSINAITDGIVRLGEELAPADYYRKQFRERVKRFRALAEKLAESSNLLQ